METTMPLAGYTIFNLSFFFEMFLIITRLWFIDAAIIFVSRLCVDIYIFFWLWDSILVCRFTGIYLKCYY